MFEHCALLAGGSSLVAVVVVEVVAITVTAVAASAVMVVVVVVLEMGSRKVTSPLVEQLAEDM